VTVRDRAREASRREIAATADALFLAEGYEQVTLERVARETGASTRTLMRYFGSKDNLALAEHLLLLERFEAGLRRRPPGVSVVDHYAGHLRGVAEALQRDPARSIARFRMVLGDLALRSRFLSIQQRYEDLLAEGLADEAGVPGPGLAQRVQAASIVAAHLALARYWLESDGGCDLRELHPAVRRYTEAGLDALPATGGPDSLTRRH
jgi:AcrR family transcriptional regulator